MKLVTLQDLNVTDNLMLFFDGELAGKSSLEHELEPFLQALEEHAGEWMPDIVKGKRKRKYSRESFWKAFEERRTEYVSIVGLFHTKPPFVSLTFDLALALEPPTLRICLEVQPLSFFTEPERCRKFTELVHAWTSLYPTPHALAHSTADLQLADVPSYGRDDETTYANGFDAIYEVFWLNIFGPKLVEAVGRERMLSTPAHRVEALPNGSILLVTWPTAADFASDEARLAQARAHVHLRPDLDFDTLLRTLRERSATLAPVEPRFHPDVAPLLSRLPDDVAISHRQQRIAQLNAWQPPEPDEWLPTPLASDVDDPGLVRKHYAYLAEHLVALLHTPVPSVFKATPESLTDVDFHFWSQNFPEVFQRKNIDASAVPAVGAYLGEVLVRHLGGEWIARQKLEEAQVRVGNRIWLPFVRAYRYMRSRQALLDFSLTQFYRVAERHRS